MSKRVSVGMERVIYMAAMEPEFRGALLAEGADRGDVVAARGLEMKASELAMLRSVSGEALRANIHGLDTSGDNLERRTFLRAVAASAVAAGAVGAMGCSDDDDKPGVDQGVVPQDQGASRGISPDMPAADTKVKVPDQGPAPTGIRPGG